MFNIFKELQIKNKEMIHSLENKKKNFEFIHMGSQELKIGDLEEFIQKNPELQPPRTGHLGDWNPILSGNAGGLDFNNVICSKKLGYPLIYSFTQTEAGVGSEKTGDWVYLPGTLRSGKDQKILPLSTWNGKELEQRDRMTSLFCPFVWTEINNKRLTLSELHMEKFKDFKDISFRFETSFILDHVEFVKKAFIYLLKSAQSHSNAQKKCQSLVSHSVTKAGIVKRCLIRIEGDKIWLNDFCYNGFEDFANAALIPFEATLSGNKFLEKMPEIPEIIPVFSHLFVSILSALFSSHLPDGEGDKKHFSNTSFISHFHWGARSMAGYPPIKNGYFSERSNIKALSWICDTLHEGFPSSMKPIFFILLPASIYLLYTSSVCPTDSKWISDLIHSIDEEMNVLEVKKKTEDWFQKNNKNLSDHFLSKFFEGNKILNLEKNNIIEPIGFKNLKLNQACTIVGVFHELSKKGEIK